MAITRQERDQSTRLPKKKLSQLTDAAIDLNIIARQLEDMKKLSRLLRNGRLNLGDVREASWQLELLANQGQADLARVLLKLMHIGAEIRPTYTGDDRDD